MTGFWTGLLHGTLMCGATLAALSLAFPREGSAPSDTTADVVTAGDEAVAPQADVDVAAPRPALPEEPAEVATVQADAPAAQPVATGETTQPAEASTPGAPSGTVTARPALEPLPEPIGSDFRRGWDDPPTAPAVSPAPSPNEVPRSVAALEETAPAPAIAPVDNPPLAVAPAAPAPVAPAAPAPVAPETPQDDAPAAIAAPARVADPSPERLPERGGPDAEPADNVADPEVDTATAAAPAIDSDMLSPEAPRQPAAAEDDVAALVGTDSPEELSTPDRMATPAAPGPVEPAEPADRSMAALPEPSGRAEAPDLQDFASEDQPAPATTAASATGDDAPAWSPRPAPDLSIPPAFFTPGAPSRSTPALSRPDAATPPAPDLSDLYPGASR